LIYIYIYIVIFSLYLFCYCFFILFKLLFKPKILGLFLAKKFYYIKNKFLEPRQSMNTMSDELCFSVTCDIRVTELKTKLEGIEFDIRIMEDMLAQDLTITNLISEQVSRLLLGLLTYHLGHKPYKL